MTHFCSVCGAQLRTGETHRVACAHCEHRMRGWLNELPRHLPLLAASLHRDRQGPATASLGAGRAHAPAPAREDVLNLLGPAAPGTVHAVALDDQAGPVPMHARLHAWAEQLAEERNEPLPPAHAGELHTGYLTAHLPYALRRPWYPFMHGEIGGLVREVRNITRTQPRRHALAAPCPDRSCQAFQLVREDWATWIVCDACGRLLSEEEYADHAAQVMPPLYRTALQITLRERLAAMPLDHSLSVPAPYTVRVRCLLLYGEEAEITADAPPAERAAPVRYPAAEIAEALAVDTGDLPGMVFLADVDDADQLSNWRRP